MPEKKGGFTARELQYLLKLYSNQSVTVDKLPYSEEFDLMVKLFKSKYASCTHTSRDFYITLLSLRKAGKLPRKTERKVKEKKG